MFIHDAKKDDNELVSAAERRWTELQHIYYFKRTRSVRVHENTCQMMNMSNRFPPFVIRGYKLLIPLLCRGIIADASVFLLKKNPINVLQHRRGPPDLFAFFSPPSVEISIASVARVHLDRIGLVSRATKVSADIHSNQIWVQISIQRLI